MKKCLNIIARINGSGVSNNEFDLSNLNFSKNINESLSLYQMFKDSVYRTNIIILWFIYIVSYTSYYVISYYIGKFPGNLFVNAFAIIFADIVANLSMSILAHYFGIKRSYTIILKTICYWIFEFLIN